MPVSDMPVLWRGRPQRLRRARVMPTRAVRLWELKVVVVVVVAVVAINALLCRWLVCRGWDWRG